MATTTIANANAATKAEIVAVADTGLAATALQPADVGTAAAEDVGYFATAAQGSTADSALQDVVDDTSPTLGGNLAVDDYGIPLPLVADATSWTPALTDGEKLISLGDTSPITATIPANASIAYPVGTKLNFLQSNTGAVTVAITSDTLNVNDSFTAVLNGQWAVATAVKIAATSWVLFGNLVPA